MARLERDFTSGVMHPRENIIGTGTLGAANAEVVIDCDGCATVSLDMRGTFSLTTEVAGTVDGVNWAIIPLRSISGGIMVAAAAGTVSGTWLGNCAGFRKVRARCTAYTSGGATVTLTGSTAGAFLDLQATVTPTLVTAVGAASAAVTLTLPAPGAGLRQYLTYLSINRFASAVLTAAAAPVTVTTTNLPGTLAFSFPADAALLGSIDRWREDFAFPLAASAQNTAVTIVCPVTTGVIWRVTGGYYVAP